jgi:prostaglandin-endoperoxide synthase 2
MPASTSFRTEGLANGLEIGAVTHLPGLWRLLRKTPRVNVAIDRLIIDRMVYKMRTRPNALSTMSSYTSWESLTDRSYSARHLPPDPALQRRLPPPNEAAALFLRDAAHSTPSQKSTLLFPHFAQWFVDGFLRTDPNDPRKNTSTHDIDLSQLYGQTRAVTMMLRSGSGGRLKSQIINGEEFPPYYFDEAGNAKPEFADLPLVYPTTDRKAAPLADIPDLPHRKLFAMGIARGNIHYGFVMIGTIFLREHNRLADAIADEHPEWDDERIFQTARDALIVCLLKIVIEDYINHITPFCFDLFVVPGMGTKERWYRQNWMSIEFDLLYRWHPLVPTRVTVGGEEREIEDVLWNNEIVTSHPLGDLFEEASRQPSTEIGLFNTAPFLIDVERTSIEIGRDVALASYNDYRHACSYPRMRSFADVSADPQVQAALAERYRTVDDIELYVGLFAEDVRPNAALPTLMGTMVGVDAFSQALTNPLLTAEVFGEQTFARAGLAAIDATHKLADIVHRNVPSGASKPLVTFTRESWRRT